MPRRRFLRKCSRPIRATEHRRRTRRPTIWSWTAARCACCIWIHGWTARRSCGFCIVRFMRWTAMWWRRTCIPCRIGAVPTARSCLPRCAHWSCISARRTPAGRRGSRQQKAHGEAADPIWRASGRTGFYSSPAGMGGGLNGWAAGFWSCNDTRDGNGGAGCVQFE